MKTLAEKGKTFKMADIGNMKFSVSVSIFHVTVSVGNIGVCVECLCTRQQIRRSRAYGFEPEGGRRMKRKATKLLCGVVAELSFMYVRRKQEPPFRTEKLPFYKAL